MQFFFIDFHTEFYNLSEKVFLFNTMLPHPFFFVVLAESFLPFCLEYNCRFSFKYFMNVYPNK